MKKWIALVLVCGWAGSAASQTRPEAVVRAFFTAQDDGRWADAASLLALNAFEPYREDAIRRARAMKGRTGPTPEEVMARDPNMPRVVAEYVAKQYASYADSDALSLDFAHTTSPDALAALPVEEAAARWLEARGSRWQFERAVAHLPPDCIKPKSPLLDRWPPKEVLEPAVVTGSSGEAADSVSYVLFRDADFRATGRISKRGPPGVVTLFLIGKQWKIVPLPDLGIAAGPPAYAFPACVKIERPSK